MKKLLILGAAAAVAVTLAACGGGGGGGATAAAPSAGKTVSVKEIGGAGSVLVDSSGQALYASDQEAAAGNKVLCDGACNSFWKPLTVSGGASSAGSVPGKVAVAKRPDGSSQVTYNGKLLYSFTQDGPDQVTGDGFKDAFDGQQFVWHVMNVGNGGGSSAGSSSGNGSSAGSSSSGGGSLGY